MSHFTAQQLAEIAENELQIAKYFDALQNTLPQFTLTADLKTWGRRTEKFGPVFHENLEGTFTVAGLDSIPEGMSVFLNFSLAVTQVEGWDQTIISESSRAYMHNSDFSHTEELGEDSPSIGSVWSKRDMQHMVTWMVADSVRILDGWFNDGGQGSTL